MGFWWDARSIFKFCCTTWNTSASGNTQWQRMQKGGVTCSKGPPWAAAARIYFEGIRTMLTSGWACKNTSSLQHYCLSLLSPWDITITKHSNINGRETWNVYFIFQFSVIFNKKTEPSMKRHEDGHSWKVKSSRFNRSHFIFNLINCKFVSEFASL